MFRSAASKVMWVGRATVFLVGLAVILALVFGVTSTALGANGGNFILGKKNVASAVSTLVKQGPGPALNLVVKAGQPPLKVNSSTKVANLNSDKLDNREASSFANGVNGKATDADRLDGKDSADFYATGAKVADSAHADDADNALKATNATSADSAANAQNASNAQNSSNADRLDGKDSTEFLTFGSTLKTGETLTGIWGAAAAGNASGSTTTTPYAVATIQFAPKLAAPIPSSNTHYVTSGSTANCPGRGQAAPGHLCVYQSHNIFMDFDNFIADSTVGASKDGTILYLKAFHPGSNARGTWAVTAP